jgi:uncharacterized membrane protein
MQYITQLFLVIGFIRLIFKPKNLRFTAEYIALIGASALLLLACIFIPYFTALINTTRFYHITLFLLAPLCILGGEAIWSGMSSLWHKIRPVVPGVSLAQAEDNRAFLGFIALAVLIPYFLFTSGFIFEVTKNETTDVINEPYSIALSSYRLDLAGVYNWQDGAGADWLARNLGDESFIYADSHGCLLLYDYPELRSRLAGLAQGRGQLSELALPEDGYIFLRAWNIDKQELTSCAGVGLRRSRSFDELGFGDFIESKNRIYGNGGAQVLVP